MVNEDIMEVVEMYLVDANPPQEWFSVRREGYRAIYLPMGRENHGVLFPFNHQYSSKTNHEQDLAAAWEVETSQSKLCGVGGVVSLGHPARPAL